MNMVQLSPGGQQLDFEAQIQSLFGEICKIIKIYIYII